jgi:hypothetical protein
MKKATILDLEELQTQCKPKMRYYIEVFITKYFIKRYRLPYGSSGKISL